MRPQVDCLGEIELPAPGPAEKESPRAIYFLIGCTFGMVLVVMSICMAIWDSRPPLLRRNELIATLSTRALCQSMGEASMEAEQKIVSR